MKVVQFVLVFGRARKSLLPLLLLLLLLLTLPAVVQAQFNFTTNNGTITITGYTGGGGDVAIPSTTNGYPVTSIGDCAFDYWTSLTNIMIPNSILSIGVVPFRGCSSLTAITVDTNNPIYSSLDGVLFNHSQTILITYPEGKAGDYTIPNSATNIEELAFEGCFGLTNLTIGNNVTSIGFEAFISCSRLRAITVDTNNPVYSSQDGVLFDKSQATLIEYPNAKGATYAIPNSVTSIADNAFDECINLASVTIGTDVTNIGDEAFLNCNRLSEIYFNGNAPTVGEDSFGFGPSIRDPATAYYLPGTTGWSEFSTNSFLPVVQWNPLVLFDYTTNGSTITITGYHGSSGVVTIPSTCNGLSVTSIGDYAFTMDYSLTSITIPNSVTNIGRWALFSCAGLTNATIADGVISIGIDAFFGCTCLTDIIIPNSVTDIGIDAFNSCIRLTNLTIGNNVNNIGGQAFESCTSLTSVTIPNSVSSIGDNAFAWCASLTNAMISNSVTNIGIGVFAVCSSLTEISVDALNPAYSSVDGVLFNKSQTTLIQCPGAKAGSYTISKSVTGIGDDAFDYCTDLTSVTIPNSVTSIGDSAFNGCRLLANVTIPDSVTGIGDWAFSGCASLTSATIPNTVTNIGEAPFTACGSLTAITVDALNPSYISADGVLFDKSQTTIVEYPGGKAGRTYAIPDSVTSIGGAAFADCTSLTTVTIPNSVTSIGDNAFGGCASLTNVTIPSSVKHVGAVAFDGCSSLTAAYFTGNTPTFDFRTFFPPAFQGATNATVYYLPGTIGWDTADCGRPTAFWVLPCPVILTTAPSFGIQTDRFGFVISWATNVPVVVEASTTLANAIWLRVGTNTLTNGCSYFSDPAWTNYPARFYRLRSP